MMGYGFGFMGFFWILALVGVVILVVVLARGASRSGAGAPPPSGPASETPEDILRRRYARGEIDREEYRQRLEDLRR
jgi:putative membrane protein